MGAGCLTTGGGGRADLLSGGRGGLMNTVVVIWIGTERERYTREINPDIH